MELDNTMYKSFAIIVIGVVLFLKMQKKNTDGFDNAMDPTPSRPINPENDAAYKGYEEAFRYGSNGFYGGMCNQSYVKRYMYNASPPSTNSSYDIRDAPAHTPSVSDNYGIFYHTDIYGNDRNQRHCAEPDKVCKGLT